MKRRFYDGMPRYIEYNRKRYRIRLTVANVLRYIDLCDEPQGFNGAEIAEIGFSWIVRGGKRLSPTQKAEILSLIFKSYVNPPHRKLNNKEPQSVVDFYHDSGYIYAAFMQEYGIDLYKQAHKLHWCEFLALFEGLREGCVIRQIMSIRAQETPTPTKYNQSEIQRLTELKLLYALPAKQSEQEQEDGLNKLFDTLMTRAR